MEKDVCVITGGGSGMGLAAAKLLGTEYKLVISGRTKEKLQKAVTELQEKGITAQIAVCDVSDKKQVQRLAQYAKTLGRVSAVIHAAGMSPHMGDGKKIMKVNAIGTIYINNAFYEVMESGCVIDVSSMSAYLVPKLILPQRIYPVSRTDPEKFLKKMIGRVNLFPSSLRSSIAYSISKNFVIWYSRTDAARFGKKGIRVLSVSPGIFETPMGELEKEEGEAYIKYCAIKRFGKVEEIAYLFKVLLNSQNGYLTGTDILCDGGMVAFKGRL